MELKEIKITYQKTEDIIPYEKNPRINNNVIDDLVKSIEDFGFQNPVVVDKNNVIIVGHSRLLAAKKIGMKEVPTIIASELSEEKVKAFRIADNKIGEIADWDFDLLKEEIEELSNLNYDISALGFNQTELNEIAEETIENMDYYLDLRNDYNPNKDEEQEQEEIQEDDFDVEELHSDSYTEEMINKMLDIRKHIYLTYSNNKKQEFRKRLNKLEREWEKYKKYKKESTLR